MMNIKNRIKSGLLLSLVAQASLAVQINPKGLGEVLIYPYYTVNNDLNTLYSVVNTTADTKALQVRFLEGDIGMEVLTFNVYLSAFDVWTGALIPSTSTIGGHVGEPSVVHVTSDTSCAPFLVKASQEFLPFVIDVDLDTENMSMQRAREGHLEIIEMATFTGPTVAAADHGSIGIPTNCASIQADWQDNGIYDANDDDDTTGGLIGSVSLVNVAEGIAFSYDAIALQNFWQGEGLHSEPGSLEPNLNSAAPESKVLLEDGELAESTWEHGFQAVSAVLMKNKVVNEYAFDGFLNGKTEWVLSFPTKGFHSNTGDDVLAPFTNNWDGVLACETTKIDLWDREEMEKPAPPCGDPCSPLPVYPSMCKTANVLEFNSPATTGLTVSKILGSDNFLTVNGDADATTESGWAKLKFPDSTTASPNDGPGFKGLPVTGFAVQQYTNAGAADGLLAQYGALFKHKGAVKTD